MLIGCAISKEAAIFFFNSQMRGVDMTSILISLDLIGNEIYNILALISGSDSRRNIRERGGPFSRG